MIETLHSGWAQKDFRQEQGESRRSGAREFAEKAADHIFGRPLLPAATAPYYLAANWQMAQR